MNINDKLINACGNGDLDIIKRCFKLGVNIHADNDYALQWAAFNGHLDVVQYLIENGADIHAMNDAALQNAKYFERKEVVQYLENIIKKEKAAETHFIILDGKKIQLSEEGYILLRQNLFDYM
jgi:ankyrin repeat protein